MRIISYILLAAIVLLFGLSLSAHPTKQQVYNYAKGVGIKFPIICTSQAVYESGNFSSSVYIRKNNCLGFKLVSGRYRSFKSWKDCVVYYKVYQLRSGHYSSYNKWLIYVGSNYSTNRKYYVTLRKIINYNKHKLNRI